MRKNKIQSTWELFHKGKSYYKKHFFSPNLPLTKCINENEKLILMFESVSLCFPLIPHQIYSMSHFKFYIYNVFNVFL
jgi:hypothetical protein